jgi:phospholipase/carboxylesterase
VLVHGRHGNEDVPWIFARNIPDHWLIVSPRGIEFEPESAEHETGYSWIEMPEAGWPMLDDFDGAVQAFSDFINALPDVYDIDPNNVIILGFSQGAATALATAIQHPKICRGIATLVGFVPDIDADTVQAKPLKDVSVFMAAGDRDERVSVEIAIDSRETVGSAGADVTWNLYQTGHKLNGQGMRDLATWLSKMME